MRFSIIQKTTNWFKSLSVSRKILLIAFIALLLFCSPWLYGGAMRLYESYERQVCSANGGEWSREGWARRPFCTYPYPDGGKPCHSSEQCIGGCVIYEAPIRGQPTPSTGVCRYDNNPFVCKAPIEDPGFFVCPE